MYKNRFIQHAQVALSTIMLFAFMSNACAQQMNDTLRTINVHGQRKVASSNDEKLNNFSPGQQIKTVDTIILQQYRLQSLANLLTQQEPVFVKSYGFNSLATLNFRGSSAAQSEVLWNGVPIQNAALGISDISELPVMLINKVNVIYGSSAALWGSGNVGGAVLIENETPIFDSNKKNKELAAGLGSYSQYQGGINASTSFRKWYFSLKSFGQTAHNNFPYTNELGRNVNMANSRLQSGALIFQGDYKVNARNIIGLSAWYQSYDREIPPALFETISSKKQLDKSLRLLLEWNGHNTKSNWYIKNAFSRDYMHYQDDTIALSTKSISYQNYFEAGWKWKINNNSQLLVFAPMQLSWIALSDSIKQQAREAVAAAYDLKLLQCKLDIAINARGEVVDNSSFLLPGVNASYKLTNWLSVRANVQRTYRVPTLNELYYFPGGNKDLKPEQGWNEDGGYTLKIPITQNISFHQDVAVFNRLIKDWIVWFGGAIWTPHNIASVRSRGIETENDLQWQVDKFNFHLGINTSYILATTVSSYIVNDGSIGKQIPYTPRYNGQLNVGFSYRSFYLNYNYTYTGYRFITTDESEYVSPYTTGNLQLMYDQMLFKRQFTFNLQLNNIWNAGYQIVAYRPMPGINWLLGIKVML